MAGTLSVCVLCSGFPGILYILDTFVIQFFVEMYPADAQGEGAAAKKQISFAKGKSTLGDILRNHFAINRSLAERVERARKGSKDAAHVRK